MNNLLNNEYESFINKLNYPVVLVDENYVLQVANKKFLKLHLENLVIDSTVIRTKEFILDNKNIHAVFKLDFSKLFFENNQFYLISFFETTKFNKKYEDLLMKKKMFEQLSEYLSEAIVLFDEKIIYSNPAFEKICGYTGRELLSKGFIDLLEDSDKYSFSEQITNPGLRKKSFLEQELRLVTKKNKIVWARVKTNIIFEEEKKLYLNIVTNISNEKLEYEKLNKLAYFDALTEIYNRRKFNELFLSEYKRAKRYKRDLSAIFFDIDHFKKINDTYGHDVGDIVLHDLAHLVQLHVRETDLFARWGGEEFIILLPETSIANAFLMAEHIREEITKKVFEKVGYITISLGITELQGQEQQKSFLKRLDNALYKAKKEGRNCSIRL